MTAFGEMVRNTTYVVQTPTCFVCGKDGEVEVPMEGKDLREQMMTGIHPQCWEATYGSMEGHA